MDYNEASAVSWYVEEIEAAAAAMKALKALEIPGAYIDSAEIKIGQNGARFAELWFDTEVEVWRARLDRES